MIERLPLNDPLNHTDTKVKGLIFDCDGTLTDSMPLHFIAWNMVMSRNGIEFSEDRFYSLGGMPSEKIISMLSREHGRDLNALQLAEEKEQGFLDHLHLLEEIPMVTQVVRTSKGKLPMAVASGGLRHIIELQLQQIGLHGWFDALVTAEDTERHKPEPDVFLEAARRLNVPPQLCRVYEDSDLGIEAARRAGMTWVDVREFHRPRRITPVASS
jgi:HAD superfamily hydrolase (TIGR01509 family)